jgi:hypothetical protein
VEIKNRDLNEHQTRDILRDMSQKTRQIKGFAGLDVQYGIVARNIEGRQNLENEEVCVWEMADIFHHV